MLLDISLAWEVGINTSAKDADDGQPRGEGRRVNIYGVGLPRRDPPSTMPNVGDKIPPATTFHVEKSQKTLGPVENMVGKRINGVPVWSRRM